MMLKLHSILPLLATASLAAAQTPSVAELPPVSPPAEPGFELLPPVDVLPTTPSAPPAASPPAQKSKKSTLKALPTPPEPARPLPAGAIVIGSLADLRQRVLEANWSIQSRMMDFEVKRRTQLAAKGMFDPALSFGYNYEDSNRPNTVEQRRNLSGVPELDEKNHSFQSSIETLTPLGSRLSLTASVSEYRNNLQRLTSLGFGATGDSETVSFIGVAFVQPLLKNAGRSTATAAIRVAACETEQAWQDFRRQLMVSLSSSELAFWNVHGAAMQAAYMQQSVDTARRMAADTATLMAAGKAAAADVATAEAGVQERTARLIIARQKLAESKSILAGFCGVPITDGFDVRPAAPPGPSAETPDPVASLNFALGSNPDYLAKVAAKGAEDIRTAYMKNQKLPQLDLKASYGLNGIGTDLGNANEDITGHDYPAWGVGIELTMPLGNREAKHRYAAALARQQQAVNVLSDLRTQLGNAVDNAVQGIISSRNVLAAYHRAIALNQQVLSARTVDHREGKADVRRVLEAEEDLNQSLLDAVSGLIQHRQALLEFELATGQVLASRAITITKEELAAKTAVLAKGQKITPAQYQQMLSGVRESLTKP